MLTRAIACAVCVLALAVAASAADWPMSRFDVGRTCASPQSLPAKLHLQWSRQFPPLRPAWPDQAKMQTDADFDPIVVGRTLYVATSHNDGVSAFDVETGKLRWHYFADGPVRYAPAAWEGQLYFGSDDGHLYCLDAESGVLRWKFRGAPTERHLLGNGRLISTWPVRGAPVVKDGTVYFGASIWPFMGIFLHALDARTGRVKWTNDGDGSTYMKQPHSTDSFAGVAPQGAMVLAGDVLLVPGGRSVPACYDRRTGQMTRYQLADNGKRGGGSDVSAIGKVFFNGGSAFDVATEKWLGDWGQPVVLTDTVVYALKDGKLLAYDLATASEREAKDEKGKATKKWIMPTLASVALPWAESLVKAGDRLYVGGTDRIAAFDLPLNKDAEPSWQTEIEGSVSRLVVGADRLFAITRDEMIHCFAADAVEVRRHPLLVADPDPEDEWTSRATDLLKTTGVREGWCIAWGVGSGRLILELVRQSELNVVVVEPDERKVRSFRERLMALNLYGDRVAVLEGELKSIPLPPYLANLIVSEELPTESKLDEETVSRAYEVLRPYGGVLCLPASGVAEADKLAVGLPRAVARVEGGKLIVTREGALPGAADWTHEHADASNTRFSRDKLVKAPLGVLWFGGPSNDGVLPRHGHGPQPQVIDGRLFIEGVDMLRAMDIYTGRVLWEKKLPGVGAFYNNLAHQPGANAAGTNFISTSDGIYIVHGRRCLRLDPATGKEMSEFHLPPLPGQKEPPRWGYLNVVGDLLIGGADPLFDEKLAKIVAEVTGNGNDDDKGSSTTSQDKGGALAKLKALRLANDNLSASRHLVILDRHTGKELWSVSARNGFRHNATCVGSGRLYTIDRVSGMQLAAMREPDVDQIRPRLRVFDLRSGKELWTTEDDVFGTWLSYSIQHDVLVEAGRANRDSLKDEPSGIRVYRADTGRVLWHDASYTGAPILHGDTILLEKYGCDLLTGKKAMRTHPLTGEIVEWSWMRNYGCNTPAASEHLLTFRSGAAGYFDYCNDSGTGNFGGFRSSCTNNLIVAGGLLVAPDYTRTCVCNYQNQTSIALIHMPDAEMWTSFGTTSFRGPVKRVGINFGAPGDRKAADGTLWLEHPSVGGASPTLGVKLTPDKPEWFRRHAVQVQGDLSWVAASGVKGVESVTVTLDGSTTPPERRFTVRLHFAEPDDLKAGQRVFAVRLQGKEVLRDFDVVREAGGPLRAVVKEFVGIQAGRDLTVKFTPAAWAEVTDAILSGVEVVEER